MYKSYPIGITPPFSHILTLLSIHITFSKPGSLLKRFSTSAALLVRSYSHLYDMQFSNISDPWNYEMASF
jgi:hypothetical protein